MERTSPGQALAMHPFRKAETTNLVLQATEAFQNTFMGRPGPFQGLSGVLNGMADADIDAASFDGGGNLIPGTGDVTIWKFDFDAGVYKPTNIKLPSGLPHNLSSLPVIAGNMLVLIPRDSYWQIIFESCPA